MSLETNTSVGQLARVKNTAGQSVPPATGEFAHKPVENQAIGSNGSHSVTVTAPDRATTIVVHAEVTAAATATIAFQDSSGTTVTSRTASENSQYSTSGSGDIFVSTQVASPYLKVTVSDTSGGANTLNMNIMVV